MTVCITANTVDIYTHKLGNILITTLRFTATFYKATGNTKADPVWLLRNIPLTAKSTVLVQSGVLIM